MSAHALQPALPRQSFNAAQHKAMLDKETQHNTTHCRAARHNSTQYSTIQHSKRVNRGASLSVQGLAKQRRDFTLMQYTTSKYIVLCSKGKGITTTTKAQTYSRTTAASANKHYTALFEQAFPSTLLYCVVVYVEYSVAALSAWKSFVLLLLRTCKKCEPIAPSDENINGVLQ